MNYKLVIDWKNDTQFAQIIEGVRAFYKEVKSDKYGINPILDEEGIRETLHETGLYFKPGLGELFYKEDVVNLVMLIERAQEYFTSLPNERLEAIIQGLPYSYYKLHIRLLDPLEKTFKLAFVPFEHEIEEDEDDDLY